ncbi:MAG TPA: Gfo/Idh/MocA family oxidoreductase [Chloroflexota bacterium]|nr:Gfo/Idh/MocA family oxidoreductase [Chloroflexota bacterium]
MSEPRPLRLGLAGLGVGASQLLPAMTTGPHVRLTAVGDVRQTALDQAAAEYGIATHRSIEELCRDPNVDVVWVATPSHLHAEHAILAAEGGKHVIVSKPLAITLDEAEAMNAAAERNGVLLLAGHTQSMAPAVRKLADLARGGVFGRLGMIHTWHYTDWMYRPRLPEELDSARGGGPVFRQASHQVDIVRLIGGGLVRSVRAMTVQLDAERGAPGSYTVYLEFADGTPATIVYSGYGHFETGELTGKRSMAERVPEAMAGADERAQKEALRSARRGQEQSLGQFGLTIVTCERADLRESPDGLWVYERGGRREIPVPRELRGAAELEEMYQAVVHGRPLSHDGRWGLATLEVCLAIHESARTRQEVVLSQQTASPN